MEHPDIMLLLATTAYFLIAFSARRSDRPRILGASAFQCSINVLDILVLFAWGVDLFFCQRWYV
ncbi:hypothetical protein BGW80DRAFT_1308810, partial [Lactifluus volemus]